MSDVDLERVVKLLESDSSADELASDEAWDTHKLWRTTDREMLPILVELLSRHGSRPVLYALKSIRRIGGDLDEYLEAICGCTQSQKRRGFCDEIAAAGINGEIAAIVRESILGGSSVARKCGVRLVEEKAVSWFDCLRIRWLLRRYPSAPR
jgi:hypothetical protein